MRKRRGLLVVLATSTALVVFFGMNVASGQTVLHLVVSPNGGKVRFIDHNEDGMRLGDRLAARAVLIDSAGAEAGTAYLDCGVERRLWDDQTGLWNCTYVLDLDDGDIVLQGLDPRGPGMYELAVLGGTGAYSSASGDATFTDTADSTEMVINLNN